MRARIYNEKQREDYISEIYGIINRAGEWYIVDDIVQKDKLVLVEYLNFKTSPPYEVNLEIIDCNPIDKNEWINLVQGEMNISQVAYSVGFNDLSHFSRTFKKHFGVAPRDYSREKDK